MGGDGGRRKAMYPDTYGTTECPGAGFRRSTSRGSGLKGMRKWQSRRASEIAAQREAAKKLGPKVGQ